jgi:peroxiredoxin
MRALEPVYLDEHEDGLVILAVNVGQSAEVAGRFARSLGITYDVALDPDAEVSRRYGVVGLPLTYFVDRGGRVRSKILGEATAESFSAAAAPLLAEPPP